MKDRSHRAEIRKQRVARRNKAVRTFFNEHQAKHPQWRFDAVVELTAEKFYLAELTVTAIIMCRPPYDDEET